MEVILCNSCRAIISTEVHFLQEVDERDIVIFEKCSVDVSKDILVSKESFDKYCTYQELLCKWCQHPVGKVYRALNDELIYMLNKYILDKNMLDFEVFEENRLNPEEQHTFGKIEVEIDVKKYDPLMPEDLIEYYDEYNRLKRPIHYALHMCTKFSKQLAEFDVRIQKMEFEVQSLYRKYMDIKNKQAMMKKSKKKRN